MVHPLYIVPTKTKSQEGFGYGQHILKFNPTEPNRGVGLGSANFFGPKPNLFTSWVESTQYKISGKWLHLDSYHKIYTAEFSSPSPKL
jgi:hypothetical protein